MGWAATSWALKAEAPTPSAKLVLLVLAARGHRLPKNWRPDEDLLAFGAGLGFTRADLLGELLDEFADYWRAVPGAKGLKLDWSATFRNSLRKTKQRLARPARGRPAPRRNPLFEDLIDGAARARAHDAGDRQHQPVMHRLEALEAPRLKRIG